MQIFTSKDRASRKGPADWFTGNVWIDPIILGEKPSNLRANRVSFEPGARTAWHTHPVGQTLHVLTGSGLVQLAGQPVLEIHPGDTVSIAPNELHWHGASEKNTMVHLAIQEADESNIDVVWLGHVTDEEYLAR